MYNNTWISFSFKTILFHTVLTSLCKHTNEFVVSKYLCFFSIAKKNKRETTRAKEKKTFIELNLTHRDWLRHSYTDNTPFFEHNSIISNLQKTTNITTVVYDFSSILIHFISCISCRVVGFIASSIPDSHCKRDYWHWRVNCSPALNIIRRYSCTTATLRPIANCHRIMRLIFRFPLKPFGFAARSHRIPIEIHTHTCNTHMYIFQKQRDRLTIVIF